MQESYRGHFASATSAEAYEAIEYADGSYSQLLWSLEQPYLKKLIAELARVRSPVDALDFATGTGRIASFLEQQGLEPDAVEVSPAMAELAARRLKRTRIITGDITSAEAGTGRRYDLITCFRFFLNAEPALRRAAMIKLAAHLKDESSCLVFNNHGNLWSSKLLAYPVHRLKRPQKARPTSGNVMTHREIKMLLNDAGLRIVRRHALGFLGGKAKRILGARLLASLESICARLPNCGYGGQDVLYVVALDGKHRPCKPCA